MLPVTTFALFFGLLVRATFFEVSSAYQCPGRDWVARKGSPSCYFVYVSYADSSTPGAESQTFEGASEECRIRGGSLLTVDNDAELDYVKSRLASTQDYYWIGLTYKNGQWVWAETGASPDPALLITLNPQLTQETSNGVNVSGQLTYDYFTRRIVFTAERNTYKAGFICKAPFDGRPLCKVEDGWSYDSGRCYLHVPDPKLFFAAQDFCYAKGGYIATINSEREDAVMRRWIRERLSQNSAWLGITIENKTAATTVADVQWEDGTPINGTLISHWPLETSAYIASLADGKQYCGELFSLSVLGPLQFHNWKLEANCLTSRHPFACESRLNYCPYGWEEFDNNGATTCYQLVNEPKTYQEARNSCTKQNADLATVKDAETQRFLRDLISQRRTMEMDSTSAFWIGAQSKKDSPGQFQWVNGSDMSFTNWTTGVPPLTPIMPVAVGGPAVPVDYCVFMDGMPLWQSPGTWNATVCNQKLTGYICAADNKTKISIPDTLAPDVSCESPFERFHDGCYLFVDQKMNREEAQAYCQRNGSNLVTLNTLGENLHVLDKITRDSWIGLKATQLNSAGSGWILQQADGVIFTSASYNNYLYPTTVVSTNLNEKQNCFFMISKFTDNSDVATKEPGRWYKDECAKTKAFVCYHDGQPQTIPEPVDDSFDAECGFGWVAAGDTCYKTNPDPTTWAMAKQNCQNAGPNSELLYISTKSEADFVRALAAPGSFIGPLPAGSYRAEPYWIDLYTEKEGHWYWPYRSSKDHTYIPMAFFNWAEGQPTYGNFFTTSYTPRCAFMQATEEAGWEASSCTVNKAYICRKPRISSATSVTSTVTPLPATGPFACPTGFFPYDNICISLNRSVSLGWEESRNVCREKGGELLSIHNQWQYQSILPFTHNAWIGLNSIDNPIRPRIFSWSDGTPVTYTPWDISTGSTDLFGNLAALLQPNCVAGSANGFVVYNCFEEKYSICETAPILAPPGPDTIQVPHAEGCDRWSIGHQGSCFYFGNNPLSPYGQKQANTFTDARTFCQQKYPGSDLATIDSTQEKEFISSIISTYGADFWIGLKEERDPWNAFKRWLDGSVVTVANWAYGQPIYHPVNGALGCVALQGSYNEDRYPGQWYTDKCDAKKFALCEAPRRNFPTRPPTTPGPNTNGCPKDWLTTPASARCYKGYYASTTARPGQGPHKSSWYDAEAFCQGFKNGHLASIDSQQEQDYMLLVIPQKEADYNYWIGLREETILTGGSQWGWSDGTPLTTTFYHPNVNHESEQMDCVGLDAMTAKWIKQTCSQSWGWICEVPKGAYKPEEEIPAFPTVTPINNTCGRDTSGAGTWYYYPTTDECLYISRRENTWDGAVFECIERGAYLAVITPNNSAFITQTTSQQTGSLSGLDYWPWIGLRVVNPVQQLHEWIDYSPLTYTNWEIGQPAAFTTDTCAYLNTRSGKWRDRFCSDSFPFICTKPSTGNILQPTPRPTKDPNQGGCKAGWQAFRGDCYYLSKFRTEDTTFAIASTRCKDGMPYGNLASILDSAESDFLVTLLRQRTPANATYSVASNVWVGLQEKTNNMWAWTDGKPYQFTNWYYDYPKPTAALECIEVQTEINKAGKWTNVNCYGSRGYVCKAPKDSSLLPVGPIGSRCDEGFHAIGDSCFRVVKLDSQHISWEGARATCRGLTHDNSSDIATILDIYENSFVRNLVDRHLVNDSTLNVWIGMREKDGHYVWQNSCPATFSNIGSLINQPSDDLCLYANEGKWYSSNCSNQDVQYAVCEKRLAACPPVANITSGYCPLNFSRECSNHCFHIEGIFVHDNRSIRITFDRARHLCQNLGGELASIRNAEDQRCIQSYIQGAAMGLWIGLVETYVNGDYAWGWLDEDFGYGTSQFANWDTKEPNLATPREGCAEMQPTGKWNNVRCTEGTTRGYICEAPKTVVDSPKTSPSWDTSTPLTSAYFTSTTTGPGETVGRQERSSGMSDGTVAGIVIGILLIVGIGGCAAFVVVTGRTQEVINRVRSITSTVQEGSVRFVPKRYKTRRDDTDRVLDDNTETVAESYS